MDADDLFFGQSVTVPANVLVQQLPEGECVILNLDTERYYGLDDTGAQMWAAVTGSPTISDAFDALASQYEVEPERLRGDLRSLVADLAERGLLTLT